MKIRLHIEDSGVFCRKTRGSAQLSLWPALMLLATPAAQAADYIWQGGAGNWTDAHWDLPEYPNGNTANAFIDGNNPDASSVDLNTDVSVGGLTLDSEDNLTSLNRRTLTLLGGAIDNRGMIDGVSIVGNGSATLNGYGTYQNLSILGTAVKEGAYSGVTFSGNNALVGDGRPQSLINLQGANTNTGTLRLMLSSGEPGNSNPAYLNQGSVLTNAGTIDIADPNSRLWNSGTVTGGTITGLGGIGGSGHYENLTLQGLARITGGIYSGVTFSSRNGVVYGEPSGRPELFGANTNMGTLVVANMGSLNVGENHWNPQESVLTNQGTIEVGVDSVLYNRGIITGGAITGSGHLLGSGYYDNLTVQDVSLIHRGFFRGATFNGSNSVVGDHIVDGRIFLTDNNTNTGTLRLMVQSSGEGGWNSNPESTLEVVSDSLLINQGTLDLASPNSRLWNGGTITGGTITGSGYIRAGSYENLTMHDASQISTGSFRGVTFSGSNAVIGDSSTGGGHITLNDNNTNAGTLRVFNVPGAAWFEGLRNEGIFANEGTIDLANANSVLHNFGTITGGTITGQGILAEGGTYQSMTLQDVGQIESGTYRGVTFSGSNTVLAQGLSNRLEGINTNAGTLTGTLINDGEFVNNGQFQGGLAGTGVFRQAAGATVVDTAMAQSAVNIAGGTLAGNGEVDTSAGLTVGPGGTLHPGSPGQAGTLAVGGDLVFAGGTLDLALGGTEAGQFSRLNVSGAVTFGTGHHVDFNLINGYAPQAGDSIGFLNAGGGIHFDSTPTYRLNGQGGANFLFNVTKADDALSLAFLNPAFTGTTVIQPGSTLVASGNFTNEAGSVIDNQGDFQLTADSTLSGGGVFTQNGGSLRVNGDLSQAEVQITNQASLSGSGTITSDHVIIFGGSSVNPGNSPGTLNIVGDMTYLAGSSLNIEVQGLQTGEFDVLNVNGDLVFQAGSQLNFYYTGADATSLAGHSLTFLNTSNLIGVDSFLPSLFGFTGLNKVFTQHGNSLSIAFNAEPSGIPLPGTLWLFGTGAAALVRAGRRTSILRAGS